jgi:hypothetical protein
MTERRACQLANQPRGTQRYRAIRRKDEDALSCEIRRDCWETLAPSSTDIQTLHTGIPQRSNTPSTQGGAALPNPVKGASQGYSTFSSTRSIPVERSSRYIIESIGVPDGIRTRVTAVKGRCPRPLDDGDARSASLHPQSTTSRLTTCLRRVKGWLTCAAERASLNERRGAHSHTAAG